jgi:Helitron helicase-like domain at N-terminus
MTTPDRQTRAERMANPTTRDAVRAVAENHGACLRPIQLRRTNTETGEVDQALIPCGATLTSICPPCAERAKQLRAAQCREGWHMDTEPIPSAPPPDKVQAMWVEHRAQAQTDRDRAAQAGQDTTELDELIADLDHEIRRSGLRGNADPGQPRLRRQRSTRRRQDAPDLPKRKISPHTIGKTYTAPDGKTFRPSMFITLTCPSYGKVLEDGTPADPGSYNYQRAARDALHFAALFDRFIQNLRRVLGYDVQYFATIEPQKRLAPHVHIAIRGTVSRAELRQIIAATYHQVWWPPANEVRFDGDQLPVWHKSSGCYLDPDTGELLTGWDDALDAISPHDDPMHVARFGAKFDARGVLAGSQDSARCIGYLTKYLTKQLGDCHHPETDAQRDHVDRLAAALRYEPCSPTCANWLRYGIQPKNPRPGLVPGQCKGKAHRHDHLGYAGRRVLVSRKWSGKTLADHRGDRKAWLTEMLGLPPTDSATYRWEQVRPGDEDYLPPARRLLHAVADRLRWENALAEARRRALDALDGEVSATGRAA